MKRTQRANRDIVRGKSKFVKYLRGSGLIVVLAVLLIFAFFIIKPIVFKVSNPYSIAALTEKWENYDYQAVYDIATVILRNQPFNNTVLTYRGYAAFYLAVSSTISSQAQEYIDEAIRALRLAVIHAKERTLPQIYYMLGKTYFYKNSISSYHYYADLAVEYLTLAKQRDYKADDISEYLGLSYAQLEMTMESIAAFSEALLARESDTLLLSIAEQYFKVGQPSAAKQYLFRIIQSAEDDSLVIKSRMLLGKILLEEKNYDDAQKEFETILEGNENSADAHYGLGLVYEGRGNLAKARSEWRKTLRIQVNHADALGKIQYYR